MPCVCVGDDLLAELEDARADLNTANREVQRVHGTREKIIELQERTCSCKPRFFAALMRPSEVQELKMQLERSKRQESVLQKVKLDLEKEVDDVGKETLHERMVLKQKVQVGARTHHDSPCNPIA